MTDEKYIKADLEDYANFDNVENHADESSIIVTGPGRKQLLATVLEIDNNAITEISNGSYQGMKLFIFRAGGKLWLLKDAYGSCSHCDGYLSADDDESYKKYALSMCRNAYAFTDKDDAIAFLEERTDDGYTPYYGWGVVAEDGIEILQ